MRTKPSATPLAAAEIDGLFDTAFRPAGDASPLLLAASGGPDSTALMEMVAAWSARLSGPPLVVATVDHGLRSGSRSEAEAVGVQAAALGLPHTILFWERAPGTSRSQSAARTARYRLLTEYAGSVGARRVVTAHTADDQAETVLMRLAAGSGPAGLGGMRERTRMSGGITLLRPFLPVPKARLVATCRANGWSFVTDPSNADPRYARPRWRALADTLATEGLSPNRLGRLAARLRRADEALDAIAGQVAKRMLLAEGENVGLPFAGLLAEPDEIALRILARAMGYGRTGEDERAVPVRLERLERAYATLRRAADAGQPVRLTLAQRLLALDRHGMLQIGAEAERRRGHGPNAAGAPQSLGKDVGIVLGEGSLGMSGAHA